MMTRVVISLLLLLLLVCEGGSQPLQDDDDNDGGRESSHHRRGREMSSLRGSGHSSSSSLSRAVITFDPSESMAPLEFRERVKKKPKGKHLKESRWERYRKDPNLTSLFNLETCLQAFAQDGPGF